MADDLELRRFLVQAALDPELRALARRDPEAAFAGFALSADDREVLAAQDERVLALLGRALQAAPPGEEPAGEEPPSPPPVQVLGALDLLAKPVVGRADPALAPAPARGPGTDWGHRLQGADLQRVIARVQAADPPSRYAHLVQLARILRGG